MPNVLNRVEIRWLGRSSLPVYHILSHPLCSIAWCVFWVIVHHELVDFWVNHFNKLMATRSFSIIPSNMYPSSALLTDPSPDVDLSWILRPICKDMWGSSLCFLHATEHSLVQYNILEGITKALLGPYKSLHFVCFSNELAIGAATKRPSQGWITPQQCSLFKLK